MSRKLARATHQRPCRREQEASVELKRAQALAQEVVDYLAPYCERERVVTVGSIRRRKPLPRDVDMLLIPANQGALLTALQGLGEKRRGGPKIEERLYKGVQLDLYFATPETWATLLLIRTGSKEHNIKLTTLAKRKGWTLHASGKGLCNAEDERIAWESEESIFQALGLPFVEPWEREP